MDDFGDFLGDLGPRKGGALMFIIISAVALVATLALSNLKTGSFPTPWDPLIWLQQDMQKFEKETVLRKELIVRAQRIYLLPGGDPDSNPYWEARRTYRKAIESGTLFDVYFEMAAKTFHPPLKYSEIQITREEVWDINYRLHIEAAEALIKTLDRPRAERQKIGWRLDASDERSPRFEDDERVREYVLFLLREATIDLDYDTPLSKIKVEIKKAKDNPPKDWRVK